MDPWPGQLGAPAAHHAYGYGLNNPTRNSDPSGQAPPPEGPGSPFRSDWDVQWQREFMARHERRAPSAQDWAERQLSLQHPGTGPGGTWTPWNWYTFGTVKSFLTPDLMQQIGSRGGAGTALFTVCGRALAHDVVRARNPGLWSYDLFAQWQLGPDGTIIAYTGYVPGPPIFRVRGVPGWTVGNVIIFRSRAADTPTLRVHEYVHVLQYRSMGLSFLPAYLGNSTRNQTNWTVNPLEQQAVNVQGLYAGESWLPQPWELPYVPGD